MLEFRLFNKKISLYYTSKKHSVCNWYLGKWDAEESFRARGYRILGISILIERIK